MFMPYIEVHTDGGARGNPGPAAIGVVIKYITVANQIKLLAEFGKRIGETTNNVAEYQAVIAAYEYLIIFLKSNSGYDINQINFKMDSNLVANQLNGTFKVKDSNLRLLYTQIKIMESEVKLQITYSYIPRIQNSRADYFVNLALDH
jgi:ribonuclease HI